MFLAIRTKKKHVMLLDLIFMFHRKKRQREQGNSMTNGSQRGEQMADSQMSRPQQMANP